MQVKVDLTDYLNLIDMARYSVRMAESYSSYSKISRWQETLDKLEATPIDSGLSKKQRDVGYMKQFISDCSEMGAD